jgi:nitroimidazol reductase NimA-like FMN-containing flavoprotein (pyridoxamine 5'-phosphate oxidase superfamily)
MSGTTFDATERTTVRRLAKRGSFDRATVYSILDEALFCHVGFVIEGKPVVIPTIHARRGDLLYLHGSQANRMLRTLRGGVEACVTVTLLDGLVIARSAFHHSMNYRSVVVYGVATEVTDRDEKLIALETIVEHVVPGRTADARGPTDAELRGTLVLSIPLEEVSAKIRTGGPIDDEEDYALPIWAGELPFTVTPATPIADSRLAPDIALPDYIARYERPAGIRSSR